MGFAWQSMAALAALVILAMPAAGVQEPAPLAAHEAEAFASKLKLAGVDAATFDGVLVRRDLQYARYGDVALQLDLYVPRDAEKPLPCVVVIVGGGFRTRAKNVFAPMAAYLASEGFAAACIGYRGVPDAKYPAAIHDAKAAVRFLRSQAAHLQIDPDRIAALGQSAGGYLTGMLAVSQGVPRFDGDGDPQVSSRIQAAVAIAGVFDFITRLRDGGQQPRGNLAEKRASNGAWVGEPFSESSQRWREASPIHYVSEDDPPILLVHCRGDGTVPVEQSKEMFAAVRRFSDASRLVILEGSSHGVLQSPAANAQAWRETLTFLRDVLGTPKSGG